MKINICDIADAFRNANNAVRQQYDYTRSPDILAHHVHQLNFELLHNCTVSSTSGRWATLDFADEKAYTMFLMRWE